MKKILLIIAIVVILVVVVVYFYGMEDQNMLLYEEMGEPYVIGRIYDISDDRILIAENWNEEDEFGIFVEGTAIWLTIDEETKIVSSKGDMISFVDLEVGNKAKVWTTGAILESYPAQGTAFVIMIEDENDEVAIDDEVINGDEDEDVDGGDIDVNDGDEMEIACYVGGCSGELCTADTEAISTCELLSGMECIREGMSCKAVDGECTWVMSQKAAECFMEVEENQGVGVRDTRIGYLFEKAEKFLE